MCKRGCIITLVAFVWFFSTVCFQMRPQSEGTKRCIVTLVAFVWLLSTVSLHMFPQWTWIRGCIITLFAFVWLDPTVHFQMSPQSACMRGCIITLVAFVWLFSTVRLQVCPQIAFVRGHIIALVAFVQGFSLFHGNFHILIVYVVIFKNFIHFQFLHSIVLLPMTTWYWGKSEVLENTKSELKRESENRFQIYNYKLSWTSKEALGS